MAFNVASLTAYVDQNRFPLITSSVFGAKSISMLPQESIMTDVKYKATVNIFETNAGFQTADCTFNASGDTTFSQREVQVGKIKVQEQLCIKDLENYYLQTQLPVGSKYTSVPFEEMYSQKKADLIAAQMDTAIWQGDTSSGNKNLNKFDGWLKIIDAASASTVNQTPSGALTASNIVALLQAHNLLVPAAVIDKDDLRTFIGWPEFRLLLNALTNLNLYHYTTDPAAQSGEITLPGTTMKIVAVHGLDSTNRIITCRLSNLRFATDMMNEEERFRIYPDIDELNMRFHAEWKAGAQIALPAEIVQYKAA